MKILFLHLLSMYIWCIIIVPFGDLITIYMPLCPKNVLFHITARLTQEKDRGWDSVIVSAHAMEESIHVIYHTSLGWSWWIEHHIQLDTFISQRTALLPADVTDRPEYDSTELTAGGSQATYGINQHVRHQHAFQSINRFSINWKIGI